MIKKINNLYWVGIILSAMLLMGAKAINISNLSDPTRPPDEFMPATGSLISYQNMVLSAIFVKPNSRMAIISGQAYHENDAIGEYVITNIYDNTVELIDKTGNKQVLQMAPTIKRTVSAKEN